MAVAQTLAGLPMFSGLSMRLLSFVLAYALPMLFLCTHVRRLEKGPPQSTSVAGIVCVPASGASMGRWGRWFAKGMGGMAPAALLLLMAGSIRYTPPRAA